METQEDFESRMGPCDECNGSGYFIVSGESWECVCWPQTLEGSMLTAIEMDDPGWLPGWLRRERREYEFSHPDHRDRRDRGGA